MRRALLWTTLALVLGSTGAARAGDFWQRYWRDYERSRTWPYPFVCQDRAAAKAPWEIMTTNGWRAQNTLTAPLFDPEQQLTDAGKRKVFWIATQAPEMRRSVFIMADSSQDVTGQRLASVQAYVAQLNANGIVAPEVAVTDRQPMSWSGDYYEQLESKRRAAIQAPTLPDMVSTTGGQ